LTYFSKIVLESEIKNTYIKPFPRYIISIFLEIKLTARQSFSLLRISGNVGKLEKYQGPSFRLVFLLICQVHI